MKIICALPDGTQGVNRKVSGAVVGARISTKCRASFVDGAVCGEVERLAQATAESVLMRLNSNERKKYLIFAEKTLASACAIGCVPIVNMLLKRLQKHLSLRELIDSSKALVWATKGGHTEVVRALLNVQGMNVNSHDVLYLACEYNHLDLVNLFLTMAAIDPNQKLSDISKNMLGSNRWSSGGFPTSPLWIARHKGHDKIVQRLLQHPDINRSTLCIHPWATTGCAFGLILLSISIFISFANGFGDLYDDYVWPSEFCYNTGCGISNNTCQTCTAIQNATDCSTSDQCSWNRNTFKCEEYAEPDCPFEDKEGWTDQWFGQTCTDWSANCKEDNLIKECSDPPERDSDDVECEIGGFGPWSKYQWYFPKSYMEDVRSNCTQSCSCDRLQDVCNFNSSMAVITEMCTQTDCGDLHWENNKTCQVCDIKVLFNFNAWIFSFILLHTIWLTTLVSWVYVVQLLQFDQMKRNTKSSHAVNAASSQILLTDSIVTGDIELTTRIPSVKDVDIQILVEENDVGSEKKHTCTGDTHHTLRTTKALEEMHREMNEADEIQLALALSASMLSSSVEGGESKN